MLRITYLSAKSKSQHTVQQLNYTVYTAIAPELSRTLKKDNICEDYNTNIWI